MKPAWPRMLVAKCSGLAVFGAAEFLRPFGRAVGLPAGAISGPICTQFALDYNVRMFRYFHACD